MGIFDKVKLTVKENGKNPDFSRDHKKYKVVIKTASGQYTTEYSCNPKYNNPTDKKDILYCLFMDANCINYVSDIWEFAAELGYNISCKEEYKKVEKIYKACKKTDKAISRLFTQKEIEELTDFFNNY